jgi:hypothetical protein
MRQQKQAVVAEVAKLAYIGLNSESGYGLRGDLLRGESYQQPRAHR